MINDILLQCHHQPANAFHETCRICLSPFIWNNWYVICFNARRVFQSSHAASRINVCAAARIIFKWLRHYIHTATLWKWQLELRFLKRYSYLLQLLFGGHQIRMLLLFLKQNYAFLSRDETTHAESINSDLQRGLDRRLLHTQHWTQNRTS